MLERDLPQTGTGDRARWATPYDAIIVGAGHNGLTAAGYLGKAGLKTLVYWRQRAHRRWCRVVTEEIHPGFRVSTVSYVVSLLQADVIRDLELKDSMDSRCFRFGRSFGHLR